MKKLVSLVLVVVMLLAVVPSFTVFAAASGTCGDNLTWTLDNSGTLTISGTGAMWDYLRYGSPFYTNSNEIGKTCGFTENMKRKEHGLPLRIGYGAVAGREY